MQSLQFKFLNTEEPKYWRHNIMLYSLSIKHCQLFHLCVLLQHPTNRLHRYYHYSQILIN